MKVNIKFCGGCNPRYQRGEFAKEIQTSYSMHRYVYNGIGEADLLIVLYGCDVACASLSDCCGVYGTYHVTNADQWNDLCEFMDHHTL